MLFVDGVGSLEATRAYQPRAPTKRAPFLVPLGVLVPSISHDLVGVPDMQRDGHNRHRALRTVDPSSARLCSVGRTLCGVLVLLDI